MHKCRLFLIFDLMINRFIFIGLLSLLSFWSYSQSGMVASVGVSMAFSDNPAVNKPNEVMSGWHASLSGRFGNRNLFLRPGLELHKVKLQSKEMLDPFSNLPAAYFLKIPLQIGYKLINTEAFKLRLMGGGQFCYTAFIEENELGLDHNSINDASFGALVGAGVDFGPLVVDFNFEKGLTALYHDTDYKTDYIFVSIGFFF